MWQPSHRLRVSKINGALRPHVSPPPRRLIAPSPPHREPPPAYLKVPLCGVGKGLSYWPSICDFLHWPSSKTAPLANGGRSPNVSVVPPLRLVLLLPNCAWNDATSCSPDEDTFAAASPQIAPSSEDRARSCSAPPTASASALLLMPRRASIVAITSSKAPAASPATAASDSTSASSASNCVASIVGAVAATAASAVTKGIAADRSSGAARVVVRVSACVSSNCNAAFSDAGSEPYASGSDSTCRPHPSPPPPRARNVMAPCTTNGALVMFRPRARSLTLPRTHRRVPAKRPFPSRPRPSTPTSTPTYARNRLDQCQ